MTNKRFIPVMATTCLLSFTHAVQAISMTVLGEKVNVRAEANQKAKSVGLLDKETIVEVVSRSKQQEKFGKAQDYWYQVESSGTTGWVFGSLLTDKGERITVGSGIQVRAKPNTKATVLETLAKEETVMTLGRSKEHEKLLGVEDYWYQIKSPTGKEGWVFGGLLLKTGQGETLGGNINVRTEPHAKAKIVETLPNKGQQVSIIGRSKAKENLDKNSDYWYQVKTPNGKQGWIFGAFLMPTE